jgi:hypothetical protein
VPSSTCFIGVVSYEGSRFAVSQGPDGLAAQLERALPGLGVPVSVQVNTQDFHDEIAIPVDIALIQASLEAQRKLESAWAGYVAAGRAVGATSSVHRCLRWGLRQWRRVRPPDARFVRRLINIELSHVDLLRAGIASGADWILVIEDDAATLDVDDCARGLADLMHQTPASVRYVNVSESFSVDTLGISHLLTPVPNASWAGGTARSIVSASRPVTNTVCAILYRSQFAQELLDVFDTLPMTPVVPIDWKLNEAIMRMNDSETLGDGSCWLVTPAPIDQLSMRSGDGDA